MPSIFLKTIAAHFFYRTGLAFGRLKQISRGKAGILMYHRVLPMGSEHPGVEPGMFVYDTSFERHVAFLKENFHIVPLQRLLETGDGARAKSSKPTCILTFDDGWADFYAYAYPVLKAHQVQATVFLPTDFIDTDQWFWTDRLGFLLLYQAQMGAPAQDIGHCGHPAAHKILHASGSTQSRLATAIAELKTRPMEEIEKILEAIASVLRTEPAPPGRAFLTWEEVREMGASGLIGFGSHTAGHAILTTIGEAAVREELVRSKQKLLDEKIAAPGAMTFCYPNGNHNAQISRLVRQTGYGLAVSTQNGWNGPGQDRFALKRIPIHNDMTAGRAMFLSRLAGIF